MAARVPALHCRVGRRLSACNGWRRERRGDRLQRLHSGSNRVRDDRGARQQVEDGRGVTAVARIEWQAADGCPWAQSQPPCNLLGSDGSFHFELILQGKYPLVSRSHNCRVLLQV